MIALLRKAMSEVRRGTIGWSLGLFVVTSFYAIFYPSVQETASELDAFLQALPEGFRDIMGYDYSSPEGYLRTEAFAIFGPVLFLVLAIGIGSRTIAGEEDDRTMDLLLSLPVRRWQVLATKLASLLVAVAATGLATMIGLMLIGPRFDLVVPAGKLLAAIVTLIALGFSFGTLALAVACLTGSRPLALGVAGVWAAASYLVNAMASAVDELEPWRPLSPFRWYLEPDPLRSGVSAETMAVLLGSSLVFVLIAFAGFARRDIRG